MRRDKCLMWLESPVLVGTRAWALQCFLIVRASSFRATTGPSSWTVLASNWMSMTSFNNVLYCPRGRASSRFTAPPFCTHWLHGGATLSGPMGSCQRPLVCRDFSTLRFSPVGGEPTADSGLRFAPRLVPTQPIQWVAELFGVVFPAVARVLNQAGWPAESITSIHQNGEILLLGKWKPSELVAWNIQERREIREEAWRRRQRSIQQLALWQSEAA